MNKRQRTLFGLFAAALVLLALFPMSSHERRAAAQSEGGGLGACVQQVGGSCVLTTADECVKNFLPGLWYGEGTICFGDTPCSRITGCPPASTACCLGDGTCLVLVPELCVEAGGSPTIVDVTPCFAVNCPQPCVGDLDDDGIVGIVDFLDLLHNWGVCP